MIIFGNIVVMILEVLYYSLFMKFAKKDGKLYRYIILFFISTLVVGFINSKNFSSYLAFILATYIGLKYIVKVKASMYDILIILLMLLLNITIELPFYLIFYKLIHFNHYVMVLLFELVKLLVVFIIKYKLRINYVKFKKIWDDNRFMLRYISTTIIYSYVIITIALKISKIFNR